MRAPISQLQAGKVYFHADGLGSVRAATGPDGGGQAYCDYAAFGEAFDLDTACPAEVAFAGQGRDRGTGWYHLRARQYDPATGRFAAPDPTGYAGGDNLYAYAGNNPATYTDPTGLAPGDEHIQATYSRQVARRARELEAGMRKPPTTYTYTNTFRRAYPNEVDDVEQVHHAVPKVVLRMYPHRFTKAEIHSLANLRGIPRGQNKVLHDSLKSKWNMFFRFHPNANREQILRFAAHMDIKYGDRFLPRVGLPLE